MMERITSSTKNDLGWRRLGVLLLLGQQMATAGCATIGQRPVDPEERVLARATVVQVDLEEGWEVDAEGASAGVELSFSPHCLKREVKRVERQEGQDNFNQTPGRTWAAAGLGAAGLAAGGYLLVEAQNLAAKREQQGSTFNQQETASPGGYRVAGGLLLGVGAVALTAALVDVIRASGGTHAPVQQSKEGSSLGPATCSTQELKSLRGKIFWDDPMAQLHVGDISQGKGAIEGSRVPRSILSKAPEDSIRLQIIPEGTSTMVPTRRLKAGPFLQALEESDWAKLDLITCEKSASNKACPPIVAFLDTFPRSQHAPGALAAVRRYKDLLDMKDERAWATAEQSPCRQASVREDCAEVDSYLRLFPQGKHQAEANELLLLGQAHIQRTTIREQMRRDDEARAKAEAEAREERQKAQQRRAACDKCAGAAIKNATFIKGVVNECRARFPYNEEDQVDCGKVMVLLACRSSCTSR